MRWRNVHRAGVRVNLVLDAFGSAGTTEKSFLAPLLEAGERWVGITGRAGIG